MRKETAALIHSLLVVSTRFSEAEDVDLEALLSACANSIVIDGKVRSIEWLYALFHYEKGPYLTSVEQQIIAKANADHLPLFYALSYFFGYRYHLLELYRSLAGGVNASLPLVSMVKALLVDFQRALLADVPVLTAHLKRGGYAKRLYLAPEQSDRKTQLDLLMHADSIGDSKGVPSALVYWDHTQWPVELATACRDVEGPLKLTIRGHSGKGEQNLYAFSRNDDAHIHVNTLQAGLLLALSSAAKIKHLTIMLISCFAGSFEDCFARQLADALNQTQSHDQLPMPFEVIASCARTMVDELGQVKVIDGQIPDQLEHARQNLFMWCETHFEQMNQQDIEEIVEDVVKLLDCTIRTVSDGSCVDVMNEFFQNEAIKRMVRDCDQASLDELKRVIKDIYYCSQRRLLDVSKLPGRMVRFFSDHGKVCVQDYTDDVRSKYTTPQGLMELEQVLALEHEMITTITQLKM